MNEMIPKHAPCLERGDFVPYLTSGFQLSPVQAQRLADVWSKLFHRRGLFPTPTGRYAFWYFLDLIDLQKGDEVLVSAYNFYVMVRLVVQKGLVPVFVDIDPETLCMDVQDLERKITHRSRLVLVTHMFGIPANLTQICALCRQHELLLFEDSAHAVGSYYQTEQSGMAHVGQDGDGALFSFGVEKMINSFGGGMLTLSDELAAAYRPVIHRTARVTHFMDTFTRCLVSALMTPAWYGWVLHPARKLGDGILLQLKHLINPAKDDADYRFAPGSRAPFKLYMVQMHALQLDRLDQNIQHRRAIVQQLKDRFDQLSQIQLLAEDKHGRWNGSYFGIYVPDPEALAKHLDTQGVNANPQEFYNCAALDQFSAYSADCPHADYASAHLLRLPSYPLLRAKDITQIGDAIEFFFKNIEFTAPRHNSP